MALAKKEILIIDDDMDQINLMRKILEAQGLKINFAMKLDQALQEMSRQIPHLILLDLHLANEESGYDFLKEKAKDERLKDIPVVVQTAAVTKEHLARSLAFGAADFITKPIKSKPLVQKLKKHLKDFEFPKVDLSKRSGNSCRISCDGHVTHISEVGIIVLTPVKFESGTDLEIDSRFFKSIGLEYEGTKTIGAALSRNNGFYTTKASFTGLPEKEARKIRLLRTNK